jgi:phosphoenolpyruvate synthase/pyruvate phosphate dikinase
MFPQRQPVLWLEDPAARSARRTGGKAAALAGLADRLPVPPGFVVVGELDPAAVELAYAQLGERAGSRARAGQDPLVHAAGSSAWNSGMPGRDLTVGGARLRAGGTGAGAGGRQARIGRPENAQNLRTRVLVAVRSSAADEDGLQSSFAGQHETILGVRGIDELLVAIADCRASAHSERALHYRRANGLATPRAPLPVLVQLLVPADAAAVVFSVNPVTPRSGEVLVNAAFGLGESIVGGTVTPDEWALTRTSLAVARRTIADKRRMTVRAPGGSREVDVPAPLRRLPSISDEQARAAAALALSLEDDLGFPVDLELAWTGDDLHLLQCRPITTLAQEAAA